MKDKVTLNLGAGGREMHEFIADKIANKFEILKTDDSARLENNLVITTDSYVVIPLFFAGGDIGRLAVSGTVNDIATSGAKPLALTLSFILEEGFSLDLLERILESIAKTAKEAEVKIVTGDTKVVEKGKCDKIFINTSGVGILKNDIDISSYNAKVGDIVFVTGPIGNHEITLLKERSLSEFSFDVKSDVAPLNLKIEKLLGLTNRINVIKDPTRGGVASALFEIAINSKCEILINEDDLKIDREVKAICDLTGLDPLYLANEGKYIIIAPEESLTYLKEIFPEGDSIGVVSNNLNKRVVLKTNLGTIRKLGMLETTQLPRIC